MKRVRIMSAVSKEREAEKKVFSLYFHRLVSAIEDNILDLSSKCLSRKLINSQVYDDVSSSATPKEKASKLLTAIKKCMGHQEKAFTKFLEILKSGSIYDRLIAEIRESYRDVLNRKTVDKCTDVPATRQNASKSTSKSTGQPTDLPTTTPTKENGRERVFKQYLPKLESHIQGVTAAIIAEECQAKGLISSEVYSKVKKFHKKKRAQFLLSEVRGCVSADELKFKQFIGILARREACKDLARSMQKDVKRECGRSEMVLSHQQQPDRPNTVMTAPDLQLRRRETATIGTDGTIPVSENTPNGASNVLVDSKVVPAGKIRPKRIDPLVARVYDLKMAELHSEAELEDFTKVKEENTELKKSVSELKDEIRARDLKIEELRVKNNELELTLECLQLRVAFVEKKLHESEEKNASALRKMISDNEKQIKALQTERDNLSKKSDSLEVALRKSQESLRKSQESLEKANQKLDESIKELKSTTQSTTTTLHKSRSRALTIFSVVVGIAVLIAVLFFIVWLIRHW